MNPLQPKSNSSLLMVIIFIVIWVSAMFFAIDGGKPSVSVEQMTETLTSRGYIVRDSTEKYKEAAQNSKFEKSIETENNGFAFAFFVFADSDSASNFFAANRAKIIDEKLAEPNKMNYVTGNNYSIYTLTVNGTYYVVESVGNTAVYAKCAEEDSEQIIAILEETDYYFDREKNPPSTETGNLQANSVNTKAMIAVIVFAVMIFASKPILRSFWSLTCEAAQTTPAEVIGMYINCGGTRSNSSSKRVYNWMLVKSRNSLKFRIMHTTYTLCTVSGSIMLFFAVVSCFTGAFDKFLGYAMIIQPTSIVMLGVGSALYSKLKR